MLSRIAMIVSVSAAAMLLMAPDAAAEPAVALDGHCPVCLVKMNKLVKGDPKFSSVYDGRTYLFPTPQQKREFEANPTAFVPALGGDCVVCEVEMGQHVPGKAQHFAVHDGRLFLFPADEQKRMFLRDPHKYTDADLALDGSCPVCLVKKNEVVPGTEEYTSIYDGRRYLFPGPQQKQMFDADPAAFVPALGGDCAVCKIEMNEKVEGKPQFHLTHNGRLYLFLSQKQLDMFRSNPRKYANADLALGGKCAVCKVEMGREVVGKSEISVDYKGQRYLFPGEEQRKMFLADPEKYVSQ